MNVKKQQHCSSITEHFHFLFLLYNHIGVVTLLQEIKCHSLLLEKRCRSNGKDCCLQECDACVVVGRILQAHVKHYFTERTSGLACSRSSVGSCCCLWSDWQGFFCLCLSSWMNLCLLRLFLFLVLF
uniref:Uncharacterized protein n=2 Tax=Oreochromis TaxID=8139 RepID=A0A669BDM8_ORENI